MKKVFLLTIILAISLSLLIACTASGQPATAGEEAKKEAVTTTTSAGQVKEQAAAAATTGEGLFKRHCAICHRDGGNIVNRQKTLRKDVRESNGIKTADDIINLMRNPGPGMNSFNETVVPEKDAREIAEYILKTF